MAGTKKEMETMLATENQKEATEVMAFLGELDPEEKKDFLVFMQGIRLGYMLGIQQERQKTARRQPQTE